MNSFQKLGREVVVRPTVKIVRPEVIDIGDKSIIDDFTFIYGGKGIRIGKYVHIGTFVSVIGGGRLLLGDYAGVASGARLITGSDHYANGSRMSGALPLDQRNVIVGKIEIGKDGFIGTNAVVHPDVTIGEGAVIGSCSLVLSDCEPWTIYAGVPCKPIGQRPKVNRPDI